MGSAAAIADREGNLYVSADTSHSWIALCPRSLNSKQRSRRVSCVNENFMPMENISFVKPVTGSRRDDQSWNQASDINGVSAG